MSGFSREAQREDFPNRDHSYCTVLDSGGEDEMQDGGSLRNSEKMRRITRYIVANIPTVAMASHKLQVALIAACG
jgi:hypothetical protein